MGPRRTYRKPIFSIAFHFVRKWTARDEWKTSYIKTGDNPSDMLTKPLTSGEKRRKFGGRLLHYLYHTTAPAA